MGSVGITYQVHQDVAILQQDKECRTRVVFPFSDCLYCETRRPGLDRNLTSRRYLPDPICVGRIIPDHPARALMESTCNNLILKFIAKHHVVMNSCQHPVPGLLTIRTGICNTRLQKWFPEITNRLTTRTGRSFRQRGIILDRNDCNKTLQVFEKLFGTRGFMADIPVRHPFGAAACAVFKNRSRGFFVNLRYVPSPHPNRKIKKPPTFVRGFLFSGLVGTRGFEPPTT